MTSRDPWDDLHAGMQRIGRHDAHASPIIVVILAGFLAYAGLWIFAAAALIGCAILTAADTRRTR